MATAPLGTLLRHIHKLAAGRCAPQGTDGQLLEDFSTRRDEPAFAALVARHGPMVLRVCRRVLSHEQDAEDAFQATFLVLARNAGSIRKREALAQWLHGVAYRTAMKAKRSAARRRNHEDRLKTLTPEATASPSWDDVQAVLDEEIQRLPTTFRTTFVLCVLEGKSGPEAAATLGVKEGTVGSRLTWARKRLQQRLARRGIKLSALLAALSVAENAGQAAVPAELVRVTLRSGLLVAAGEPAAGLISSHVAALAAGVTRAMFLTKAKIVLSVLCAVGLFAAASAAVLTHAVHAGPQDETKPPATAKLAAEVKPAASKERGGTIEVRGRVLDPDGKAVPGAKLIFVYASAKKVPEKVWATSAPDGRFQFSVAKSIENDNWSGNAWDSTHVVAAAEGYGFAWARVRPEAVGELTLHLVKDDMPIQGRVLDLQGQPVAGVTVRIDDQLSVPVKGNLAAWLETLKANKQNPGHMDSRDFIHLWSPALSTLIPPVTTGADGRFKLKGIGRERIAMLRIEGATIATQEVSAMTRQAAMIRRPAEGERSNGPTVTYYGATFDLVAAPTQPVVGVVRDRDTGKPLAGVTVRSEQIAGTQVLNNRLLRTTTDEKGRYRLVGLPKGEGNKIAVQAAELPYLPQVQPIAPTPGLEAVTVDFGLKRGLWITGRVTDKSTGKPLWASVEYFCHLDNPSLKGAPRLEASTWRGTNQDGSFRMPVLPGPGYITVRASLDHYPMGVGADRITMRKSDSGILTLPHYLYPGNYHAVVEVIPKADAESMTCDVALDPGRKLTGTVLDPEGKPLSGAQISGVKAMVYWEPEPLKDATFTLWGLTPDTPRLVQVIHEPRKLAGWRSVRGDEKEPIHVSLEPWGTFTGRLVRPDGEPMTNVSIQSTSGPKDYQGKVGSFARRIQPDKDGKFRIEGLVPGLKYHLGVLKDPGYQLEITGKHIHDLEIKPGETKDLGDIQVKPME